jgi:hypothetical protein
MAATIRDANASSAETGAPANLLPDSIIWTPEIERLNRFVVGCLRMQLPGCAIAGGQRFGKTFALKFLAQLLAATYGHAIATVQWTIHAAGQRATTDKEFLQERLYETAPVAVNSAPAVLARRLINALVDLAAAAGSGHIIIMVDEAQNLDRAAYAHLIYIFNSLERANVRPFFLLVGQPELRDAPLIWRKDKAYQVVGRFFNQMYVFRGIDLGELEEVLDGFDEPLYENGPRVSASLLPHLEGQWSFGQWAPLFRETMAHIAAAHKLEGTITFPMQYLRSSLLNLMDHVCRSRIDPRLVQPVMVFRAVRNSGFMSALAYCVEQRDLQREEQPLFEDLGAADAAQGGAK